MIAKHSNVRRNWSGVLTPGHAPLLLVFTLALCLAVHGAPAPPPKPHKYQIGYYWKAGNNQLRIYKVIGQEMYYEVWVESSKEWLPFGITTPVELRKALDYEKRHTLR